MPRSRFSSRENFSAARKNARVPTATAIFTEANFRKKTRRAASASGMPTSASGAVFFTQRRKLFSPMPGSIATGTAPMRKSAKAHKISSAPGRAISSVRVPARMPRARKSAAVPAVSRSSCAKVSARGAFPRPVGKRTAQLSGTRSADSRRKRATLQEFSAGMFFFQRKSSGEKLRSRQQQLKERVDRFSRGNARGRGLNSRRC